MKRKLTVLSAVLLVLLFVVGTGFAAGDQEKSEQARREVPKRVGWIGNYMMHEWYQNVTKGMEARAQQLGIQLEIVDANLDMAKQVSLAEDLLAKGIDVMILTPVQAEGAAAILKKAEAEGIPVVVQATPVEGMKTVVIPCDYDGAYKGGVETGKLFKKKIGGKARIMAIDLPALRPCVLRVDGFVDGFRSEVPDAELIHRLDGQGLKDHALQVATDALTADPDINVVFGCNDDSAIGALQAYRSAGLRVAGLIVCGMGGEGMSFIHEFEAAGPYQVEVAMFPEKTGYDCIEAAVKLYRGEKVPAFYVTPTAALTPATYKKYYRVTGNTRESIWDAMNAIPIESNCSKE
jgi:ribose transport system substrate-binding protein